MFGADLPVEGSDGCRFSWCDGPLLLALKSGSWIVLDEVCELDEIYKHKTNGFHVSSFIEISFCRCLLIHSLFSIAKSGFSIRFGRSKRLLRPQRRGNYYFALFSLSYNFLDYPEIMKFLCLS